MSNNAAVVAAQRRRAGNQNRPASTSDNVKFDKLDPTNGPDIKRTLGLGDILSIQSRQLKFLKDYQEGNERHWEANDEFLHQLSEKVDETDELREKVTELENGLVELNKKILSLQDEILQKTN